MKETSEEKIEIGGKEYTLFINRKGIVAWEKFAKEENEKAAAQKDKIAQLISSKEKVDINDDTNPFEDLDEIDNLENDIETTRKSIIKLYWIMLYTNHKLSLKEVTDLYNKACEEYYELDLISLAHQMINDANSDKFNQSKSNLKNLPALKPNK